MRYSYICISLHFIELQVKMGASPYNKKPTNISYSSPSTQLRHLENNNTLKGN